MEDNDDVMCACPCGCGCRDEEYAPCGRLGDDGMCYGCSHGNHELPPESVLPLKTIIARFESCLAYYKRIEATPKEPDDV